jgi:hypothetical protein
VVSTGAAGDGVYARSDTNQTGVPLGAGLQGSPHRYRVVWTATGFDFYVDGAGTPSATLAYAVGTPLNVGGSDLDPGTTLSIDWMRISPYASPGTFLSRIHDAGTPADWGTLSYVADIPSGTTLALSVRQGDTPTPDGSWTSFSPIANGQDIGGSSRYLQYRVEATSSTGDVTPTLSSVMLPFTASTDTDPPGISGRTPSPGATGVAFGTDVTVTFDEPVNPATVTTSTFKLQGPGGDVPATVNSAGATATLDPDAALAPSTTYQVTVSGTVEDTSGNGLGADDSWSFTTASLGFVDTTVADFSAGTPGADTAVADQAGGEVILKPAVQAEFEGSALPSGWLTHIWEAGGSVSVSGGALTVNGARANTTAFFGAGRSLEFVATFGGGPFGTIGFGDTLDNPPWANFGLTGDGNFYARTHDGAGRTCSCCRPR